MKTEPYLWQEYLDEFDYFATDLIRKDNCPQKMVHPWPVTDSIVLIHGLTDSPGMMADLGRYYHQEMGYNVYMPLLHCHGLKQPKGMKGVCLKEWKKNVRFSLAAATVNSPKVSIGGLSTGGALAFYFGSLDARVTGQIHLFSAALGLSGGWLGRLKEILLRCPLELLVSWVKIKPLIGANPYRYSHVPLNSARELALLIKEIDAIRAGERNTYLLHRKIFSAWSECDNVVDLRSLAGLEQIVAQDCFLPFVIAREFKVNHACVVLENSIYATGKPAARPLERANPQFKEMVEQVSDFSLRDQEML